MFFSKFSQILWQVQIYSQNESYNLAEFKSLAVFHYSVGRGLWTSNLEVKKHVNNLAEKSHWIVELSSLSWKLWLFWGWNKKKFFILFGN